MLTYFIALLILFFLFMSGSIYIAISFNRTKTTLALFKLFLIVFFLLPLFLYLLAGLIDIKFGWHRNFFYLLPIYYLIIFYFLRNVCRAFLFYTISALLLIVLLWNGVSDSLSWDAVHFIRPALRYVAQINSDLFFLILPPRGTYLISWPEKYYFKKYDMQNKKVFLVSKKNPQEINNLFYSNVKKDRIFAVLEVVLDESLIVKDKYLLGANTVNILKTEQSKVKIQSPQFIKNWMDIKSPIIVIYFCKSYN